MIFLYMHPSELARGARYLAGMTAPQNGRLTVFNPYQKALAHVVGEIAMRPLYLLGKPLHSAADGIHNGGCRELHRAGA